MADTVVFPMGIYSKKIKKLDELKPGARIAIPNDPTNGGRALVWQVDIHSFVCDWLRERFEGKPVKHPGKTLWLDPNAGGPNVAKPTFKRYWYE